MLKFTEDHEWLRVEGDIATVGITAYAQDQLGDLVFVELPAPGARPEKGAPAAVVESVKAASEGYAPVSGEITAATRPCSRPGRARRRTPGSPTSQSVGGSGSSRSGRRCGRSAWRNGTDFCVLKRRRGRRSSPDDRRSLHVDTEP